MENEFSIILVKLVIRIDIVIEHDLRINLGKSIINLVHFCKESARIVNCHVIMAKLAIPIRLPTLFNNTHVSFILFPFLKKKLLKPADSHNIEINKCINILI